VLAGVFIVGIAVRLVLLPTPGLRDDLDQFVGWVHHIATNGLGSLYGETAAGPVTFGPVMGYIWAILAAVEPGFATATDASDPGIRVLMKLPAVLADLGIALVVAYVLRGQPRWAVVGAAAILLHPAVVDVGAWWGQYESVYMLSAVAATALAINGRLGFAAAAIAISVLTKPQALPLLLPFAAWFWVIGGWRGFLGATIVGVAVIVAVWLPFVAEGGPLGYLRNLDTYQSEIFNILSLRAWNIWWLVQEAFAGGAFIADDVPIAGPATLRHVGYGLAGIVLLAVAAAIVRFPNPRTLILGLAASVLVVFSFATQMHERYAYGALVFLALLIDERRARWLGVAFGIIFTLNLLAAVPPTQEFAAVLSVSGVQGVIGSIAMVAITAATVFLLSRMPRIPLPDRTDQAP
jgi:Gpi18-like mannosyltransferase